jgi:hypothetical protein
MLIEAQPKIDEVLAGLPADPEQRIDELVSTVAGFQLENEALWLAVLGATVERRLAELEVPERDRVPVRGGHRMDAVRTALAPLAETLPAEQQRRLTMATMLVCGVEAMSSCRLACGLDPEETAEVMRWAARALQRVRRSRRQGQRRCGRGRGGVRAHPTHRPPGRDPAAHGGVIQPPVGVHRTGLDTLCRWWRT